MCTANTVCFLHMTSNKSVREKDWRSRACVTPASSHAPPCSPERSRRLCATPAAAPSFSRTHLFRCHREKHTIADGTHVRGAGTTKLPKLECACAQRTGAAARESLQRERPGGLTSPAFHACGSASSFCACCHHSSQKLEVSAPLPNFIARSLILLVLDSLSLSYTQTYTHTHTHTHTPHTHWLLHFFAYKIALACFCPTQPSTARAP
jgi:hypothetical protein